MAGDRCQGELCTIFESVQMRATQDSSLSWEASHDKAWGTAAFSYEHDDVNFIPTPSNSCMMFRSLVPPVVSMPPYPSSLIPANTEPSLYNVKSVENYQLCIRLIASMSAGSSKRILDSGFIKNVTAKLLLQDRL